MFTSKIISSRHSCVFPTTVRTLHISGCLSHNPGLKKKTKAAVDPKKQQRQLERQEAKLRKQAINPPVDPDSIPDPSWYEESRQRPEPSLTESEIESRVLLQKEWARYQMATHINDLKIIRDKIKSRNDALYELRKESEFLYNEALKVDKEDFPLTLKGPMETPPMPEYEAPDYIDEKK